MEKPKFKAKPERVEYTREQLEKILLQRLGERHGTNAALLSELHSENLNLDEPTKEGLISELGGLGLEIEATKSELREQYSA